MSPDKHNECIYHKDLETRISRLENPTPLVHPLIVSAIVGFLGVWVATLGGLISTLLTIYLRGGG